MPFRGIQIDDLYDVSGGASSNEDDFADVIHNRWCVVTVPRTARGDGNPGTRITGWEILKEVSGGKRARHKQRTVWRDMETREEWKSDEIGDVIPTAILENLGDVVDGILIVRRLKGAGGKTARTYEYSSVGKCDDCGIPTAIVHCWPGGPSVRDGIVKRRTIEALTVEKMAPGDQKPAIRQESVARAEKIDWLAMGISGLITGGFRGNEGIGGIPDECVSFVLVERREISDTRRIAPAPEQNLPGW